MYCNRDGTPNSSGNFELVDGSIRPRKLRDGQYVSFEMAFMDGGGAGRFVTDAKTIDEALKAEFAERAKAAGQSTADYLAGLDQKQVEDIAADVAVAFVRSASGAGVAKQFADSAAAQRHTLDRAYALRADVIRDAMIADLTGRSGGSYHATAAAETDRQASDIAEATAETAHQMMVERYTTGRAA